MMQPECFIAYAPRGGGSIVRCDLHRRRKRCVRLVYRTQDTLSVGVLQDRQFFSPDEKRFYATIGSDDIYGGWRA